MRSDVANECASFISAIHDDRKECEVVSAGEGARGEGGWTRDEAGGGGGRRRIIVGALDLDTILDFGLVCQRYENFLDPKDTKTLSDSKDTKTF